MLTIVIIGARRSGKLTLRKIWKSIYAASSRKTGISSRKLLKEDWRLQATDLFRTFIRSGLLPVSDWRAEYEAGCDDGTFDELGYWFRYRDLPNKNEDEFFRLLDYVDVKYLAENIKSEVAMVVGFKDTVVFPQTQMAAFNRNNSKKLLVLSEYGYEHLQKISDELR